MSQFDLDSLRPGQYVGALPVRRPPPKRKPVKRPPARSLAPIKKTPAGPKFTIKAGLSSPRALLSATKLVDATKHPNLGIRNAAKKTIVNTARLAKSGNRNAQASLKILSIAQKGKLLALTAPSPRKPLPPRARPPVVTPTVRVNVRTSSGKIMPPGIANQFRRLKAAAVAQPRTIDSGAQTLEEQGYKEEAEEVRSLAQARAMADSPTSAPEEAAAAAALSAVAEAQAEMPVESEEEEEEYEDVEEDESEEDEDEMDDSFLDDASVEGFFDDVWKGTKAVIKSKVTKVAVGGLAIAFPAVGVPAAAALVAADRVVRESEKGNPKAKKLIVNTANLANKGDRHAQAAMKILTIAKESRKMADPQSIAKNAAIAHARGAHGGWTRTAQGQVKRN